MCTFVALKEKPLTRSTRSIIAGEKNRAIGIDKRRPKARDPCKEIRINRNLNLNINFLKRQNKHA